MPEVQLFGGLRDAVNGAESVNVKGKTIRDVLQNLSKKYPSLKRRVNDGVAVAINGVVYRDDWDQPIPDGAEVVLFTRIAGG